MGAIGSFQAVLYLGVSLHDPCVYPCASTSDLITPFADGGRFRSLALKAAETHLLPDAAWVAYEKDHDAQALAGKHAMFFRAVFAPTLASYLDAVQAGDPNASAAFADRLTSGVKRRLAASPAHINSLVQIVVVAKVL